MIRNKARLVAQRYTQEVGIDYNAVFAPFAKVEAIKMFLAYAAFKDFVVYQMDVKSAFLYGKIEKEVYVCQPPGFKDLEFPDRVYKVEKALYGLHQAPRAWFETLSTYLLDNGFQRGLQVDYPKYDGNSQSFQDKREIGYHIYEKIRSMIGSLMYLISSSPDIMFVVCACAKFQVTPKVSHLHAMKIIFRYLKVTTQGLGESSLGQEITSGRVVQLCCGNRLISWQCKKQTIVANSTTEVEYVAAASCYGQVL
ncbi:putative ribonuclease H-like domain-containing protein [Tanacetum coccineum]